MSTERQTVEGLIAKWRELADDFGAAPPSVSAATACAWLHCCANELEAALNAANAEAPPLTEGIDA